MKRDLSRPKYSCAVAVAVVEVVVVMVTSIGILPYDKFLFITRTTTTTMASDNNRRHTRIAQDCENACIPAVDEYRSFVITME